MTTVGDWLAANADLERLDREILVGAAACISRARILAAPETTLAPECLVRLEQWSARRRCGEPIAYLLGRQGFRDFDLAVSAAVLVPRPETELLVDTAINHVEAGQHVLDLGTGSGAIAIALARATDAQVTGADVCPRALAIATANAAALGAAVEWIVSDWFSAITGRFHVIVSNPPYIAAGDPHLEALRHEPELALVSGPDGLEALALIIDGAPAHLYSGGWLMLEHGFAQGPAVRELLLGRGFDAVATYQDLAGLDRVSVGRLTHREAERWI